jgi:hypothetical protein
LLSGQFRDHLNLALQLREFGVNRHGVTEDCRASRQSSISPFRSLIRLPNADRNLSLISSS